MAILCVLPVFINVKIVRLQPSAQSVLKIDLDQLIAIAHQELTILSSPHVQAVDPIV